MAARMRRRLDELNAQIIAMKREYDQALAALLDRRYAEAMQQYNALAPALKNAVLRVAAIRRAMMQHMLGNTSGWHGEILLPGMEPKQGKYIAPILDGAELDRDPDFLVLNINEEIRAAGFGYSKTFFKSKASS